MFSPIAITASIIQSLTVLGLIFYLTGIYTNNYPKNVIYIRLVVLVALSVLFVYFLQIYDNSNVHLGVLFLFLQYYIILKTITHASARNVITAIFMAYIAQFLAQLPMIFLAIYLDNNFSFVTPGLSSLLVIVCSSLFTVLGIHFLPLKALYRKMLNIPAFVLMSIFFVLTLIGVMAYYSNEVYAPVNITLICLIIFLILTFVLVIYFAIHSQKKEQAIHYYETYLPILDDMILNIRKTQHNHNNAIQAIASLPQSAPDYDSLAGALERYSGYMAKDTIPTQFLHFENKLLAALLYNKYCLSTKQRIQMNVTIHNHFYNSHLTEFQIVDLCGILLDNALEASHAGDTIYLEIGSLLQETTTNQYSPFSITVKNPGPEATQDFIKKIFSAGYTGKAVSSTEHGLGLLYIKSVVQKQRGYIEVSNEMITPDDTEKACRYFIIHVSV